MIGQLNALIRGNFAPQGTFDNVGRPFLAVVLGVCWGATIICPAEARDTVKDPTMHRTAPLPPIQLSSSRCQQCCCQETGVRDLKNHLV